MTSTKEQVEIGYGLDLEGESMEVCENPHLTDVLTYGGSQANIRKFFTQTERCRNAQPGESLTYYFKPGGTPEGEPDWNQWLIFSPELRYRIIGNGVVPTTEPACVCGGDPNCGRCGGTGVVTAPGGEWALYTWRATG